MPSLTESIAATRPAALVGATDWCTHPAELDVARVRGTKNPDLAAIRALAPEIVLANQEENREIDVARLRASGIDVWVTRIRTVDEAFGSLRRMFAALNWPQPDWLGEAHAVWSAPPPFARTRVAVPIWRDPWMAVGSQTFTGDVVARLGLVNVLGNSDERYPHTDPSAIAALRPDVVLLPDEPYRFTADDGPEAFPGIPSALVEGRSLTWYGPSLLTARNLLTNQLAGYVRAVISVKDNPEHGRYEAFVDGELAGHTEYYPHGDHVVFPHTVVDPEFGGQGVASTLIREALDDMRAKGKLIDPQCPFVRAFIEKHPDYADLVWHKS